MCVFVYIYNKKILSESFFQSFNLTEVVLTLPPPMEVSSEPPSNGAGETISKKFEHENIFHTVISLWHNWLYLLFFCFCSALKRELKNKQREEERKRKEEEKAKKVHLICIFPSAMISENFFYKKFIFCMFQQYFVVFHFFCWNNELDFLSKSEFYLWHD